MAQLTTDRSTNTRLVGEIPSGPDRNACQIR